MTVITSRGVENGASICTIVDLNIPVILEVIESTLATESAALANGVDRQVHVTPLTEASLEDNFREKMSTCDVLSTLVALGQCARACQLVCHSDLGPNCPFCGERFARTFKKKPRP